MKRFQLEKIWKQIFLNSEVGHLFHGAYDVTTTDDYVKRLLTWK